MLHNGLKDSGIKSSKIIAIQINVGAVSIFSLKSAGFDGADRVDTQIQQVEWCIEIKRFAFDDSELVATETNSEQLLKRRNLTGNLSHWIVAQIEVTERCDPSREERVENGANPVVVDIAGETVERHGTVAIVSANARRND